MSNLPIEHRLASVEQAVDDIRDGKIVIVVDDEDRENEGDFVMSAQCTTPEAINFMITHGRGMVCLPAESSRLSQLNLPLMVQENTALHKTAFTVTIDAVKGTTTGVSAEDRATTIRKFAQNNTVGADFARPGHVNPLAAAEGGVLSRPGHTEAVVDLVKLAGHVAAGVLCEIMDADGSMARLPQLEQIAKEHGLKLVSIHDLIDYRRRVDKLVTLVEETDFPIRQGHFRLRLYEDAIYGRHHLALIKGDLSRDPVVRIHSECMTGDLFHSGRCDCGEQLEVALAAIEKEGNGVLVYLRQEGRGIGLKDKIRAYKLQDQGLDTVEANEILGFPDDLRDYCFGAQILRDLGIERLRLLTNNPAKLTGLEGYGFAEVKQISIQSLPSVTNEKYLRVKKEKMGHLLD